MAVVSKRKLKLGWKRVLVSEIDEDLFIGDRQCRGIFGELGGAKGGIDGYYIQIDSRNSQREKAETLLHEMGHLISDYIGLGLKENVVDSFTNLQSQIFQENPWIRNYIWPEKEKKKKRTH
jgi:hypothetical protein